MDLPDDIHKIAVSIARDRHQTLSRTIADLVRRGLQMEEPRPVDRRAGFPIFHSSRPVTADDVRALDDE